MKKLFLLFAVIMVGASCKETTKDKNSATMETNAISSEPENSKQTSVYDFEFKTLMGEEIALNQFKGRKILIVNTASECGYTPQYKELQELYDKYSSKVVVLGFPANDFGGQEPGSNEEIASFCERNYGVKFPVFQKISVTGQEQHPLFAFLSNKELNGVTDEEPTWNFCKYLIDEKGKVVKFFPSKVKPMSDEIISAINQ